MTCQRCGLPIQHIHQGVVTMMGHDPLECVDLLRAELRKWELKTSILLETCKHIAEDTRDDYTRAHLRGALSTVEKGNV